VSFGFSVGPIALVDMKQGIVGAAVIQIHFLSFSQAISDCCLLLHWSENLINHVLRVERRLKQDFFNCLFSSPVLSQVIYFLCSSLLGWRVMKKHDIKKP